MSGPVTRFCYPENMFISNHSIPISYLLRVKMESKPHVYIKS